MPEQKQYNLDYPTDFYREHLYPDQPCEETTQYLGDQHDPIITSLDQLLPTCRLCNKPGWYAGQDLCPTCDNQD